MVRAIPLSPRAHLALGTAQWGMPYGIANQTGKPDISVVREMLAEASSKGIDTLDTARDYKDSEATIGLVAQQSPDHWSVFTKLTANLGTELEPAEQAVGAAESSLRQSRLALRRDRLDGVLLHRPEQRDSWKGAVWRHLQSQRDEDRIGMLGASAVHPHQALSLLEDDDVSAIQVATSILDQRLFRSSFFSKAAERGKIIFVRSIFLQGVAAMSGAALPAQLQILGATLATIDEWAQSRSLSRREVFLGFGWLLGNVRILIGCETLEQLRENITSWKRIEPYSEDIKALALSIPNLPETALNPALWLKSS